MKVFEILNESAAFHNDTTGMPTFDDMMKDPEYFERAKNSVFKIVNMSPNEYIDHVIKGQNSSRQRLLDTRDGTLINQYAEQMQNNGKPFPMLVLDYRGNHFEQEGLHRSFAAEKAGIKEVPVMIVRAKDESRGRIY